MPKRIQLSRKKGSRKPLDAVTVCRPTKWGNPFNWQHYGGLVASGKIIEAKRMATGCYEEWLSDKTGACNAEKKQRRWILDHIQELRGKDLACWCKLDESCHADVLMKLANGKEQ